MSKQCLEELKISSTAATIPQCSMHSILNRKQAESGFSGQPVLKAEKLNLFHVKYYYMLLLLLLSRFSCVRLCGVIGHPRDVPGHVPAHRDAHRLAGRAAHAQRQAQPQAQSGQDGEEHGTALPRRHPSRQNGPPSLSLSLHEGRGALGHRGCALPKLPWAAVRGLWGRPRVSAVRRALHQ